MRVKDGVVSVSAMLFYPVETRVNPSRWALSARRASSVVGKAGEKQRFSGPERLARARTVAAMDISGEPS
jgi:hypothetical protein